MCRVSPIPLLSLLLCAATAVASTDSLTEQLRHSNESLHRFVLDNGMICLVKEDHSAPVAAVEIWLGTGSAHEDENLGGGLAHYMEHMIFKGTPTRGPAEVAGTIKDAGGEINAYTSSDRTVFHTVLPAPRWKVGVDVLSDAVMNASLPEDEWAREKQVIVREMDMGKDDADRVLWKLLASTAYRVHPYRYPTIGYKAIFDRMTRDDLTAFFERHYAPDNMVTVVVGDVDTDEVEAHLRETFASFTRRPRKPVALPDEPPQVAPRFARKPGAYNVSRLGIAYHTVALDHADTPALDMLAQLIGHGRSSRLVRTVKEEQQLVSTIDGFSYTPRYPGFFGIMATFAPENEKAVLASIEKEVAGWATADFTEAEIEKARRQLLVQELAELETMKGQARSYASGEFYTADPRYGERYIAALESITADDIRAVAGRYLRPEQQSLVILSPEHRDEAPPEETKTASTPPPVHKVTLKNGLPLIVREDPRLPFVHVCIGLRGGILAEDEATSGVTELMAELLTRGTSTRSAQDIAEEVEQLGGSLSAFSGWNTFGLQARCLAPDADAVMKLLADCLLDPAFPETELNKQRDIQLAGIAEEQERPFFLAFDALRKTLFPGHPYRLNPAGTAESVQGLTREQVARQHRQLLTRNNMAVAVFGDITVDRARELAEKYLHAIPQKDTPAWTQETTAPELPANVVRREPKEQAILLVGYPGLDVADPRLDTLNVIREAMSGLSSDLGIEVREKRGLVYYVGALLRAGPQPGLFSFYCGTREEAVDEVQELIAEQVQRLARDGLREEELQRAQELLVAAYQMDLQDNAGLSQGCVIDELYGLGYAHRFSTEERIRAVSLDDVREVAATVLDPEKKAVAMMLPATIQREQEHE